MYTLEQKTIDVYLQVNSCAETIPTQLTLVLF